jgi:hypothetical protein
MTIRDDDPSLPMCLANTVAGRTLIPNLQMASSTQRSTIALGLQFRLYAFPRHVREDLLTSYQALFNAPLVVIVGWMIGKPMDLNFEIFMICLLVLSILVVGNFLRDGESNWLEGALLVVSFDIETWLMTPTDKLARSRTSSSQSPPTTTRTPTSLLRTALRD